MRQISPARALFEATRAVRTESDLSTALRTIARVISEALGFHTVAVNLYRPAWDDFCVETVHGNEEAREALLGSARDWSTWAPLLADRFLRRGAYFIPAGEFDWETSEGASYIPDLQPDDHPDAWRPDDALMVPMRAANGALLGILSVDEPTSGRRPSDDELDLLVTLADHAALAVEGAQDAVRSATYRYALERLLKVSSSLTETRTDRTILDAVAEGIRDALGFDRVAVQLLDPERRTLETAAAAGWPEETQDLRPLDVDQIELLFDPEFEVAGCFLLPNEVARARVSADQVVYTSVLNGTGPFAWDHHWLVVPLRDKEGAVIGVIWADEPRDRLLPTPERLQALRVFANQATAALAAADQLAKLRFLADHDPLTNLLNRRAFVRELEAEVGRARRYRHSLALLVLDLDGFKGVNDRHGHAAGDEVLQRVAETLTSILRDSDLAFRIGGDEFALILLEAEEPDARAVASRMADALEADADPRVRALTASFGVALCTGAERHGEELFRLADEAMYEARRGNRSLHVAA
ncbi:MAG TPA: sensor domain-containing diguanylate cyclase [Gaiellaceae bacterium]